MRTVSYTLVAMCVSLSANVVYSGQMPNTPSAIESFPVGAYPYGVAFDGANIWIANEYDDTVTKLRASDGSLQGTFTVGTLPYYLVYDGANVWVTNFADNTVTKLRASDGAPQGTFTTGNLPERLTFDGANIWITNNLDDTVTKLRASDGALQGTFAVGDAPKGIAFDGTYIWTANYGSGDVSKLRASDGVLLGTTKKFQTGIVPAAIIEKNLWIGADFGNVDLLRIPAGHYQTAYGVDPQPQDIVFDGTNVWVSCMPANTVDLLRTSGKILHKYAIPSPTGMAFDGSSVWIASSSNNTVTKIPVRH